MPHYVPGKTLKRCALCGKFHAAYRVDDARQGVLEVCYACWKAIYAPRLPSKPGDQPDPTPHPKP